jgi:hypothetical protein
MCRERILGHFVLLLRPLANRCDTAYDNDSFLEDCQERHKKEVARYSERDDYSDAAK